MTRELAIGLKPVWLIGVGTLAGLIFIALFYLLLLVAHRRAAAAMLDILCNRLVMPVLTVAVILSTFSVGMTVNDELFGGRFFDRKMDALTSVVRFPMVGLRARDVEIDAGARDQIVALNVPDGELKQITLSSTEPLTIAVNKTTQEADILTHERFEILRQEPFSWSRPREATGPWSGEVSRLQVNSDNNVAATLHIFYETTVTV
ncbi:MAG: hypothetical protein O3B95_12625, partial [Chloroflexi bacterium]|nr:hypothetical protein [Chloroflexota bacterium]